MKKLPRGADAPRGSEDCSGRRRRSPGGVAQRTAALTTDAVATVGDLASFTVSVAVGEDRSVAVLAYPQQLLAGSTISCSTTV